MTLEQTYLIYGSIAVVIVGLALFLGKWHKPIKVKGEVEENPDEIKGKSIQVRLFNSETAKSYLTELGPETVKGILKVYHRLGRRWNEDGKLYYHINRYLVYDPDTWIAKEYYRPVEVLMEATRENPPQDIDEVLDQPEVAGWWDMRSQQSTWQKIMPWVWLTLAVFVVMFMWSSNIRK